MLILFVAAQALTVHSISIDDDWIHCTAFIENKSIGATGTGFFVAREFEPNQSKLFLVSNKHVLLPGAPSAEEAKASIAVVYVTGSKDGELTVTKLDIPLGDKDGRSRCVGHPDTNVDVAVIEVTQYLVEPKGIIRAGYKVGFIPEARFASKESIKDTSLTLGDRVVVLGYPLNMVEGGSLIPVARGGTIATPPDKNYRGRPVFLIDCSTIRGSSGSPVFVPVRPYRVERTPDGKVTLHGSSGYLPELLGIVSATVSDWELILRKTVSFGAPAQTVSVIDTANFGVVFRAEVISETLDSTGLIRFKRDKRPDPDKRDAPD